ncbi:hypothetical protein KM043_015519 [Ampulex compressa]|nr:hypothetical protein KM043_015519 [Ampulex compressa]
MATRRAMGEGRKRFEPDVREGLSCVGASNLIVTAPGVGAAFKRVRCPRGTKGGAFKSSRRQQVPPVAEDDERHAVTSAEDLSD